MTLISVKTYAALLWFLLAVESMNVSTPENSSSHVTHKQLTSQHDVTTWYPGTDDDITENMELMEETHSTAILRTSAAASSSSGWLHASTAVTTAAEGDAHSHTANITETVKPMEKQSFTDTSASATASATVAASPPQPTSIPNPEITSTLSSTISSDESVQSLSSHPASPTTPKSQTSESAPGFNHTSLASETSTELPSTSQSIPATRTSRPPDTTASASISTDPPNSTSAAWVPIAHRLKTSPPAATTSRSPDTTASGSASILTDPQNSTAANSTSTAGVLIPHQPKKSPPATTTSTTLSTTAAPCQVPKDTPKAEVLPCSTGGVVKPCLIAIAALAGLATIFMVTTIILCAKLPQRRYKVRKPQQATEMMCISALLPDTTSTRPRNHVTNGVLVFPGGADSDEDGGDNLTLSSFLPENDRYV